MTRGRARRRVLAAAALPALLLSACTGSTTASSTTAGAASPGSAATPGAGPVPSSRWVPFRSAAGVVDLSAPRGDGRVVVAADGRMSLLARNGRPTVFARASDGYSTATGTEPYITLASGAAGAGARCGWEPDAVYAIAPTGSTGVIRVDAAGRARPFAPLPGLQPNGIAFDDVGRFGRRLLVTAAAGGGTTAVAIDCTGAVSVIASHAPTVEGGIAVAPTSFGSFGGTLIAPDERTGRVWAIGPDGTSRVVAVSPLAHGPDIGVESAGFVPAGFGAGWAAYVADRVSPGSPHPGTDSILRLSGPDLLAAGVGAGDLLVAGEGGAVTVVIRCATTCTIRPIADGPPPAHLEGHIVVTAAL